MNKKIFAALASATMALSATGSLAVFAEDFDVVEEANGTASVVVGTVVPASGVTLNADYFPDKDFRTGLINYLNDLGLTNADGTPLAEGSKLTKKQVEAVKTICVGNFGTFPTQGLNGLANNNVKSNPVKPNKLDNATLEEATPQVPITMTKTWGATAKDLTGIEYFTNLENLYIYKDTELKTVDLGNNTKLQNLLVAGCDKVSTLIVPETNTLLVVDVEEATNLSGLDLSGNKRLNAVYVNETKVAELDLSNNPLLTIVDVAGNEINTLNLANNYGLETFDCSDNSLYGLELPAVTNSLKSINVSNNILQSLTFPKLTGVEKLLVNDNELTELDLSNVSFGTVAANAFNVANNHIGSLNMTTAQTGALTNSKNFGPQVVYMAPEYNAVNLKESFADLKTKNVTSPSGAEWDADTAVLSEIGDNGASYTYNVDGATTPTNTMTVFVLKADVLNRLYNPNSGEHFYTKDLEEKDVLVDLGWKDEGIAWTSPIESSTPVYRLYNPNAGDHHYTMSTEERDVLTSIGWKYEGIGWYSYDANSEINVPDGTTPFASVAVPGATMPKGVTVFREYNPNAKAAGAHNYTVNEAENDFLVSVGWLEEGTAWSAIK